MGAKKVRKIGLFGHFLEKVENWPPPTCSKVNEGVLQSRKSLRDFSFSRQFMAACKKLEKVTG